MAEMMESFAMFERRLAAGWALCIWEICEAYFLMLGGDGCL
jgi:hypothetical protein